ncbi:MAG TPA: effector binding domain-containing protein [Cellvibrionaceae bacterium]|nr:effector binding domain-containing protein [Cellvibrionaceae bacterium]
MSINLHPSTLNTRADTLFAGLKIPVTEHSVEEIPALWEQFVAQPSSEYAQDNTHYGLCMAGPNGTEYMAAVAVLPGIQLPPDWFQLSVPAATFAVFPHTEFVWRIRETIEAIFAPGALTYPHHPLNNLGFIEQYTEEFNSETGLGGMSIWVPVQT